MFNIFKRKASKTIEELAIEKMVSNMAATSSTTIYEFLDMNDYRYKHENDYDTRVEIGTACKNLSNEYGLEIGSELHFGKDVPTYKEGLIEYVTGVNVL